MKFLKNNFVKNGFTLIEIMLVIAIIGTLSATIYPQVRWHYERTRDADRVSDIKSISLGLKNYFGDANQYPESDEGCVDEVLLKWYVPVDAFRSPSGEKYDEWCGPNGRYAYKTNIMSSAYVLSSRMEWEKRGNYNASDVWGQTMTEDIFNSVNSGQSEKTGKYYVASAGYWIDSLGAPGEIDATGGGRYTPPSIAIPVSTPTSPGTSTPTTPGTSNPGAPAPTSPGTSTPTSPGTSTPTSPAPTFVNCTAQAIDGWNVPIVNHNNTSSELKKEIANTPTNGKTESFAKFRCDNGALIKEGTRENIVCNNDFELKNNRCEPKARDSITTYKQPIATASGTTITVSFHGIVDEDDVSDITYTITRKNGQSLSNQTGVFTNVPDDTYTVSTAGRAINGITKQPVDVKNPHKATVVVITDTPTIFTKPVARANGTTITVTNHGIVDNNGIREISYTITGKNNFSRTSREGIFANLPSDTYTISTSGQTRYGRTETWNSVKNPHTTEVTVLRVFANCASTNMNGYAIPQLTHNATQNISKNISNTPANGVTSYTATATCNDGKISITGETSSIRCNVGFMLQWNSCVKIYQNCNPTYINGYAIPALLHNNGTAVSRERDIQYGFVTYYANVNCNDGNVTIDKENYQVTCDEWYVRNGDSCIPPRGTIGTPGNDTETPCNRMLGAGPISPHCYILYPPSGTNIPWGGSALNGPAIWDPLRPLFEGDHGWR